MKITFTNQELEPVFKMLGMIGSKGRKARAISKFRDRLLTKIQELGTEQQKLSKEFGVLDDDGEPIISKTGTVDLREEVSEEGNTAFSELLNEETVMDLTEYEPFIEFLVTALEASDAVFYGVDGKAYDLLLDKLEALGLKKGSD